MKREGEPVEKVKANLSTIVDDDASKLERLAAMEQAFNNTRQAVDDFVSRLEEEI